MPIEETEGLELWRGSVTVQLDRHTEPAMCTVLMNMNWTNSLEFVIRQCSLHVLNLDRGCMIRFPEVSSAVEVYSKGGTWSIDPEKSFVRLAPRYPRVRLVRGACLSRLTVALVNLDPLFVGNSRSWSLRAEGWTVEVRPVPDEVDYSPVVQSERYAITHHATIYREDLATRSVEAFTSFLNLIYLFLSFCSGYWVSGTFVVGQDQQWVPVLEDWGVGRVSPNGLGDGWLDVYHAEEMIAYFPKFIESSRTGALKAMLDHVVYWNTRANTNLIGPDGSLILLQAVLERLGWHVLVQTKRVLSEKGFGNLAAADQLRLLLGSCGVPLAVPQELNKLFTFARSFGLDGPEVLTRIRYSLVHPPKLSAARTAVKTPYYQAYTLAKWYVELCVLNITGFQGNYNSRVSQNRWKGKVEPVPWAK